MRIELIKHGIESKEDVAVDVIDIVSVDLVMKEIKFIEPGFEKEVKTLKVEGFDRMFIYSDELSGTLGRNFK